MIYLASPYSQNPEKLYKEVLEYVVKYFKDTGIMLFSPIVYGHNIAKANKPLLNIDFSAWEKFDLDMLSKADELWILMLDGWEQSKGVFREIEYAMKLNKKVKYIGWNR